MQEYNSSPQPATPLQPPYTGGQSTVPPPPTRRRKTWLLLTIAGVIVIILAVAAYALLGSRKPDVDTSIIDQASGPLTAADVSKMDKRAMFFAYFKNAAMQTKITTTKSLVTQGADRNDYSRVGYDYETKEFTQSLDWVRPETGKIIERTRCVKGREHFLTVRKWDVMPEGQHTRRCDPNVHSEKLNDGLNTGGLTSKQADVFVQTLRDTPGLIDVTALKLVEHKGKQYLHFSVDLNAVKGPSEQITIGAGWLMLALRDTGIDVGESHLYAYVGELTSPIHFEYYVDPSAKLPAYTEITPYYRDGKGGYTQPSVFKVQYEFGTSTFNADPSNMEPVRLTW